MRNLDSRVVAELKRRAKQSGRSLEGQLRVILSEATRPQRMELIAEADRVLDHPVYHCQYLALAEDDETRLVTADLAFVGRVARSQWQGRIESLAGQNA